MVTWSKGCVGGHWIARFRGLNTSGVLHVCLLWMCCVDRYKCLQRADPSSREILPNVYVSFSVNRCNDNLLHLQTVGRSRQIKKHNIQDNEVQLRGKIKIKTIYSQRLSARSLCLGKYPSSHIVQKCSLDREPFTPTGDRKRFLSCTERGLFTMPSELPRPVVMDIKINHSWKENLS